MFPGSWPLKSLAGKAGNDQAAVTVVAVEFFESFVLLRQPAFRSDVDDEQHLSTEFAEVGFFSADAAYGDLLNLSAHVTRIVLKRPSRWL